MRRTLSILVSVVLGLLCLAALDDLTTGNEPSFALEWTTVAATALWFGGLAWRRRFRPDSSGR